MQSSALYSAQTTVSPVKMLIFTLEGIVCSGEFRIHNPKVGGSIPPPATNFPFIFNHLQNSSGLQVRRRSLFCRDFAEIFFTVKTFLRFIAGN